MDEARALVCGEGRRLDGRKEHDLLTREPVGYLKLQLDREETQLAARTQVLWPHTPRRGASREATAGPARCVPTAMKRALGGE
ncbi:MAG: hypothetical protein COC22_05655 [Flavobacteriaceae bacterium]|nr:MAG: hypothetical protein COC22_05655 [Flavobacteriaceae bacterium]